MGATKSSNRLATAARVFTIGLSILGGGCAAEADDSADVSGAQQDAFVERYLKMHGKGVWVDVPVARENVSAALPPEVELVDSRADVPVFLFFTRLNFDKLGPVSADRVTPDWNEFLYLVPNVRFRSTNDCAPNRGEVFNYVVYNYMDNGAAAQLMKTLWSSNRAKADVRFDDARLNATLESSVSLASKVVGHVTNDIDDDDLRATWENPALALGAQKKFVRYDPEWKDVSIAPIEGVVEVLADDFHALPRMSVPFEPGGVAHAYQMEAAMTLNKFVQCDGR